MSIRDMRLKKIRNYDCLKHRNSFGISLLYQPHRTETVSVSWFNLITDLISIFILYYDISKQFRLVSPHATHCTARCFARLLYRRCLQSSHLQNIRSAHPWTSVVHAVRLANVALFVTDTIELVPCRFLFFTKALAARVAAMGGSDTVKGHLLVVAAAIRA
jgi:hypothetical protein